MNTPIRPKLVVLFAVSALSLAACRVKEKGNISFNKESKSVDEIVLYDSKSHQSLKLSDGTQATIGVSKPTFGSPSLSVQTSSGSITIRLPDSATKSESQKAFVARASEIGQNVDIAGTLNSRILKTEMKPGTVSCTAFGYCKKYDVLSGDFKWGMYSNCSGAQSATYKVETIAETYTVDFKSPGTENSIARFSTAEKTREDSTVTARKGSCRLGLFDYGPGIKI